jgi:O-Antigen ligase.
VVFYDFINFKWTDEFMALLLVIFYATKLLQHRTENNKPVIFTFFVSLFYLLYSFKIHSNVSIAIISDYVSQVKPYIGFFCTLAIMPVLSYTAKSILKKCCWIVWIYLFVIGLGGYSVIDFFMGHVSRFATAAIITGIVYLFCSPLNWKTFLKVLILVGVGAFSGRAKFFGFYVVLFLVMFLRLKKYRFQWRIKDIIVFSIALILILGVSWAKIEYYFVEGSTDSDELFARPALYMTCIEIFKDYFPFGCGLASFASNFSAEYYSSIYEEYGLDMVYGLSPDYSDFVADAYYPSLAQFGIVGVFLFSVFCLCF